MCNTNQIYALANNDFDGTAPTQAISITYGMPLRQFVERPAPLQAEVALWLHVFKLDWAWQLARWPAAARGFALIIVITICT